MQGSQGIASGRMTPPLNQPQQVGGSALNLPGSNPGLGTSAAPAPGQQVGAISPGVNLQGSSTEASSRLGASATSQEGVNPANA